MEDAGRVATWVAVLAVVGMAAAAPAIGQEARDKTAASAGAPARDAAANAAPRKADPAKPETPKTDATGLAGLGADWPAWLRVGLVYRGRVESAQPIGAAAPASDAYYLNRLRLSAAVKPVAWLQVMAQVQDTEQLGYARLPVPRGLAGGFDLRQAYVEVGRRGPTGLVVSGGRQELTLGEGRLVASSDWGNSSRTYDLGRVSASLAGVRIDVFRAAPVDIDPSRFDRAKPGEHLWGGYVAVNSRRVVKALDLYVFQKANSVAIGELGSRGDARVETYGSRLVVQAAKTLAADFEGALQRGHVAADSVSGWAGHAGMAWTPASAWKPRLALGYSVASGDANPKDGVRRTFDQLYASNHARFGLADLVGWRNMHAVEARADVAPSRKLKVTAALNRLLLATTADAWYASAGTRVVVNPKATSRNIGWEPDLFASYTVSKEMTLGAGLGLLLPGGYVRQSTALEGYWYPYVTWTLKF